MGSGSLMGIDLDTVVKLILAALLGGVIGLEREIHGRPAGFRTHLLVSLGSCVFTVTSIYFYELYGVGGVRGATSIDPARIAAQVVTGIGFLGAGAIIRDKASIRGLTSAACLWVVSAVGVACGVGLYSIAFIVTLIAIGSLLVLKKVEDILTRDTYSAVKLWTADLEAQIPKIEKILKGFNIHMMNACVERDLEKKEIFLGFEIKVTNRESAMKIVDGLSDLPGVKKIRLE
jgi:putative Mg2+ transporter-C (MgtC) family protein